MFADGAIRSWAGKKVVDKSNADLPAVVFVGLTSVSLRPTSGPLLAAPD